MCVCVCVCVRACVHVCTFACLRVCVCKELGRAEAERGRGKEDVNGRARKRRKIRGKRGIKVK